MKDIIPEFTMLPPRYVDILDNTFKFRYFHHMCEMLYRHGYKDHRTLYGAPFDFRLIMDPITRNAYFHQLRQLIEHASHTTHKSVVLVTHSLGGIVLKLFLTSMSQTWIDTYLHHWVCISAPFGGSFIALRTVTSGDHYVYTMRTYVQDTLKYITGISMVLPNDMAFDKDEPLLWIDKPERIITIQEYEQLSHEGELPFKLWTDMYKDTYRNELCKPISVNTTAVMSTDASTYGVSYAKTLSDAPYNTSYIRGDGIVPARSLLSIEKVVDKNKLTDAVLYGQDHTSLLNNDQVNRIILDCLK